ncbi:oligomeric Golgi complex subunit 1 [Echinococcus multilocularis]|uniref:Conserved oligomeric Golgi complex subunit 1 n=1 Tax=Echinococcus multilocularis TaxID=6211 RepID=A0A068Y707_ECHMU|nr:oligomeric Golgi complex subunit 1 [Echinococcus multilocularis]
MEASVTEIFEKHTADEVRRICIEIRNDVESKKMELRFLVGERHRDVIEASDNILCMKEFSNSITEKLQALEKCCSYESFAPANISWSKRQHSGNPKKLIASQLKLLLDIPEMIWSALDEMDYTGAVEFFLLGRHLSVKMHLTGEAMAAHVNPRVLVKRQWAALDDIENTIASACRKQLALPTVSDEILAQALTALLVLEDQTMRTALDEFLSGRTAALSFILGVDEASKGRMNIGVDQRLSTVVRLFTQTSEAVTKLFLLKGQIATLLEQMSKWCPRETAWFSGENLFEYLPENIAYYHVTQAPVQTHQLKSLTSGPSEEKNFDTQPSGIRACPLSVEDLTDPFKEWWQSTLGFSQQQLSTVLSSHLVDITDLVDARHTLLSSLPTSSGHADDSGSAPHPLGRRVDLWADLFQPPFLQHLEALLKSTLNEVFTDFETALLSLAKSLDQMEDKSHQTSSDEIPVPLDKEEMSSELDLASFVWSQSFNSTNLSNYYQEEQNQLLSSLDDPVDQLDICPQDLVMAYFACLVGRKDLLPRPSATQDASSQLPGPLRWRLSRLLESAAATYALFDCRKGEGGTMSETVCVSRHEISLKRRLVTPQLKRICSTFNDRLCEIVATSASEDVTTWKVLLSSAEDLLERCCNLARRVSNELPPQGGAHGAFCVARACFCLLDAYPALGATVVTATARLLAEEAKSPSFTPWTDVSKLRQAWLSTSRGLRSIAARLSLTAILRVTVESPALENLFQSLSSVCNASSASDAKLVAITSQWCEIMLKSSPQDADSSAAVIRLRVPSHPSWPLQETLFTIARSLTTLSVHTLPRGSLGQSFGQKLAEGLLNTYRRLVEDQEGKLTQPQALQLLFDVRFILRLLVWPLTSTEKRHLNVNSSTAEDMTEIGQDLLKRLEAAVDPFDLEMSSERLNIGIGHAVRTTAVLYAALLPVTSTIASADQVGESKSKEFSNLGFLALIPASKGLEGREAEKAKKTSIFGLLPFSLSQVRPLPHVTPAVRKRAQPPPEKSKEVLSAARASSDFSWFGGLSFT